MKPAQQLKEDYAFLDALKKRTFSMENIQLAIQAKPVLEQRLDDLLLQAGPEFSKVVDSLRLLREAWMATGTTEMDFEDYGEQVCTIIGCIPLTIGKALKRAEADALEALVWLEERSVSE